MKEFVAWVAVAVFAVSLFIFNVIVLLKDEPAPPEMAPPAPVLAEIAPLTTAACPVNRHAEALSVFWFSGVALIRGEDLEFVTAAVAAAVAFDPELAEMWRATLRGELPDDLFLMLLQARAWHGQCPP